MAGPFRLRITRTLSEADEEDGVDLGRFKPGYVYVVGPTVAAYLLAIDAAVPDDSGEEPALMLPAEHHLFGPPPIPERRLRPRAKSRERRHSSMRAGFAHAAERGRRRK
jgi:hypothetical protein